MMSGCSINKSRPHFLTTVAAAMLAVVQRVTAAPSLDDVVAGVNIDPVQISVTGNSSGGFMSLMRSTSWRLVSSPAVLSSPRWAASLTR